MKSKQKDETTEAIKSFIYIPLSDMEFPCRCGNKLVVITCGSDFSCGDGIAKCKSCNKMMIIAWKFENVQLPYNRKYKVVDDGSLFKETKELDY